MTNLATLCFDQSANIWEQSVVYCNCGRNVKDTVITVCGHIVCRECVDDRISTRQRKCPMCMKAFGNKDFMRVHLA